MSVGPPSEAENSDKAKETGQPPLRRPGRSHGCFKGVLGLLLLATKDLDESLESQQLNGKPKQARKRSRKAKRSKKEFTVADGVSAAPNRRVSAQETAKSITRGLKEEKTYRALYVAVTRPFIHQLRTDEERLIRGNDTHLITLATKWAPSIDKSFDRQTGIGGAIAAALYPNDAPRNVRLRYGKLLSRLRFQLEVTERRMRGPGKWDIQYSRVQAKCMSLNRAHCYQHDKEGFMQFLKAVAAGKKKVASASSSPAELVRDAMEGGGAGGSAFSNSTPKSSVVRAAEQEMRAELLRVGRMVFDGQWVSLVSKIAARSRALKTTMPRPLR